MTNIRPFLWAALAMALFLNYEAWLRDYGPRDAAAAAAEAARPRPNLDSAVPAIPGNAPAAAPAGATPVPDVAPPAAVAGAGAAASIDAAPDAGTGKVTIHTDVLDVDISLRGGELLRADLPAYPRVKGGDVPVRLLRREGPDSLYVLQSGLAGGIAGAERPTHLALFASDFAEYKMMDGIDTIRVPLAWTGSDGVKVTKTFVFKRGQYRIDLEYEVENGSAAAWPAASYVQILHDTPPVERSYFNVETYAFEGPAIWDATKYRKLAIDKEADAKLSTEITGGWLAALQHHFVSAVVPVRDVGYRYTMRAQGQEYLATVVGPTRTVEAGASATFAETLFVGPKLQSQLEPIHPELGRVADYGMLTFLSKPLFYVLDKVHGVFGNWGIAIILVTLLLKLAFYPLSEASGKSMAKMRLLGPRMKNLQETYKDDREKLGKAMMELYKREKINPAAGCLPMLIQIPVFIAFYWVLLESVEMRQAPFFGWIQDLSSRDPFFILPAIMAGAMFMQYKLQPPSADPVQQKVFMILPIVMSVTFAFFPAGLVLYWVTNTLLSIAQQWNINRRIEAQAAEQRRN